MNPQHLLEQAERLATAVGGRPRQADLRRAVSTGYYALFHLLTQAGSRLVSQANALQVYVARKYDHQKMKKVSQSIATGNLSPVLRGIFSVIPPDLVLVAKTLVRMQEMRHQADYDGSASSNFKRSDVIQQLTDIRQAFEAWARIRDESVASSYLLVMLFEKN